VAAVAAVPVATSPNVCGSCHDTCALLPTSLPTCSRHKAPAIFSWLCVPA
jgi:hypothetical protein